MKKKLHAALWFFLCAVSLAACDYKPEPILFGTDDCAHCKMRIADGRFGAEMITSKGRVLKFDAIECMAGYYGEHVQSPSDIHSMWTIDYSKPQTLVRVEPAFFLHSLSLPSPMGMFLSSFENRADLELVREKHPGDVVDWNGVLGLVAARRAGM